MIKFIITVDLIFHNLPSNARILKAILCSFLCCQYETIFLQWKDLLCKQYRTNSNALKPDTWIWKWRFFIWSLWYRKFDLRQRLHVLGQSFVRQASEHTSTLALNALQTSASMSSQVESKLLTHPTNTRSKPINKMKIYFWDSSFGMLFSICWIHVKHILRFFHDFLPCCYLFNYYMLIAT